MSIFHLLEKDYFSIVKFISNFIHLRKFRCPLSAAVLVSNRLSRGDLNRIFLRKISIFFTKEITLTRIQLYLLRKSALFSFENCYF